MNFGWERKSNKQKKTEVEENICKGHLETLRENCENKELEKGWNGKIGALLYCDECSMSSCIIVDKRIGIGCCCKIIIPLECLRSADLPCFQFILFNHENS